MKIHFSHLKKRKLIERVAQSLPKKSQNVKLQWLKAPQNPIKHCWKASAIFHTKVAIELSRCLTLNNFFIQLTPAVNYTNFFGPVVNQGVCLSCWAITATEITEAMLRRKGRDWSLSSQNLVDCSQLDYGCNGGWAANAYSYIKTDGISNGSTYVYVGVKQSCKRVDPKFKPIAKIEDYCSVTLNGNEDILKKIVARYGWDLACQCW